MKAYMKTHRGLVREQNEDTICVAEPLYVLADGMGGHQAGEVASALAARTLHCNDDFAAEGMVCRQRTTHDMKIAASLENGLVRSNSPNSGGVVEMKNKFARAVGKICNKGTGGAAGVVEQHV